MKFLEIFLAFAATQGKSLFQDNTQALSRHIVGNARRVAILLSIAVISITLFCSGTSMGYTALVESIDQGDGWEWSAGLIAGLIMAAISFGGLVYSLGESRWLEATGIPEAEAAAKQKPEGPGLDSAFALLITECALQLKESRSKNAENTPGEGA
jgi:hypothetical protein